MAVWPFACPVTWTETPKTSVIRSTVEDGYPKQRRRFTKAYYEIAASFVLPRDQRAAFLDFFRVDCSDGAIPFQIEDPYTKQMRTVRFNGAPSVAGSASDMAVVRIDAQLEAI